MQQDLNHKRKHLGIQAVIQYIIGFCSLPFFLTQNVPSRGGKVFCLESLDARSHNVNWKNLREGFGGGSWRGLDDPIIGTNIFSMKMKLRDSLHVDLWQERMISFSLVYGHLTDWNATSVFSLKQWKSISVKNLLRVSRGSVTGRDFNTVESHHLLQQVT